MNALPIAICAAATIGCYTVTGHDGAILASIILCVFTVLRCYWNDI
jgi:hypothetical protein